MSSGRPMKVLHVLHSLNMGGVETWLMDLTRHWSATGTVKMHFLATGGTTGLFDDEAKSLGAEIFYFKYGRRDLPVFLRKYRELLSRERYDAIHDHSDLASGWHFLLGMGQLPPVRVTHVHNPLLHLNANYGVTRTRKALVASGRVLVKRLATHVCGTSTKSLIEYGFSPGSRNPSVAVLHCGIDLDAFCAPRRADRQSVLKEFGFPDDALIILFAGRLDRDLVLGHPRNHKNSWLALQIARCAADLDPRVRLLMAGAGDGQRWELERHISSWGLSSRLRLIGIRKDMGRLMRAADALLFPSAEEGLGMVAVEAQAAGTPVLASIAIPSEAVVIPQIYKAMNIRHSPELWANTLLDMMKSPRVSAEAYRPVFEGSPFSIINSARRLERIYAAVPQ